MGGIVGLQSRDTVSCGVLVSTTHYGDSQECLPGCLYTVNVLRMEVSRKDKWQRKLLH